MGMSPNIDEDKGPIPIVRGEGIGICEHKENKFEHVIYNAQ